MPDNCCTVQCTNMQGKCDEKIKFYRFPTMKTEQTTERCKKWITAMKRENWPKSEKQVDNARLCSEHFVTGAKSNDPLHVDYIPTVFAFVPVAGSLRKRKSIDQCERSEKRARNEGKKKKKKKNLSQQELKSNLCKCRR